MRTASDQRMNSGGTDLNKDTESGTDQVGNYPLNCWYVAALSEEIRRDLLARTLLGQPVVLFRQASGEVAALDDCCVHRAMPLSKGWLDGDQVVCSYHGFVFAPSGECIRIPSQEHIPHGARVRSFAVRERPPFVWIWLGDSLRSQTEDPPDLVWLGRNGWTSFGGVFDVDANYLALHDNSLDLTHFPYVHKELSLEGFRQEPPPLEIEVSELRVRYRRVFSPNRLPGWLAKATGLDPARDYEQRELGAFVSPALHRNHIDVVVPGENGSEHVYEKVWLRAFTPLDPLHTRVFWQVARNYAVGDDPVTTDLREVHERILCEDKETVETVQAHRRRYARPLTSMAVQADTAAIRAHEIVSTMIFRERGRLDALHQPGYRMIGQV